MWVHGKQINELSGVNECVIKVVMERLKSLLTWKRNARLNA